MASRGVAFEITAFGLRAKGWCVPMERLKKSAAIAATAAIVAVVPAGTATAKITEVPIECENPSGHLPPGQQPECEGEAHEQVSENQNPSGHAPPGHNK